MQTGEKDHQESKAANASHSQSNQNRETDAPKVPNTRRLNLSAVLSNQRLPVPLLPAGSPQGPPEESRQVPRRGGSAGDAAEER